MLIVKADFKKKTPQELKNMSETELRKYLEENQKHMKQLIKELETKSSNLSKDLFSLGARLGRKLEYAYITDDDAEDVLGILKEIENKVRTLKARYKI